MEHSEMNKNKKEKRANMKVFCVTPHPTTVEENNTSIYEINIESDIEFLLNGGRGRIKVVPVGQPRVSVQDSTPERRKEAVGNDVKNPFIESYYPILESSNGKATELEVNEITEETEREYPEEEEEEEERKVIETADKENQAPSLHFLDEFRENAKIHLIRNFMGNQFLDMKSMLEDREGKGLHFHHHEHHHHHHYHMNEKWDDETLSNTTLETFCRMNKKKRKGKDEGYEAKGSVRKGPSRTSSSTFTKTTEEPREPRSMKVLRVMKDTKHSRQSKSSTEDSSLLQPKLSSSLVIISEKKSELLHNHVFSDTELPKIEDVNLFSESTDLESNSGEYNKVKNVRSLNSLKGPVVITDQKTVPKFSYITCECNSLTGSDTSSEALIVNVGKMASLKEEVWLAEKDSSRTCNIEFPMRNTEPTRDSELRGGVSPPQISYRGNLLCNFAQKDASLQIIKNSSIPLQYEIWDTSILEELKEIKKKIKRIERRRKEKKSSVVPFRSNKQSSDPKSTFPVTIYSNRTFIVAPENVCLLSWWGSTMYEE